MNDFFDFKNLFPAVLRKYKMSREARAGQVCTRFKVLAEDVMGEGSSEVVSAKFFKNNTLYISVPSSVWAQRVFNFRHQIITRLNEELGSEEVYEIRTVLD